MNRRAIGIAAVAAGGALLIAFLLMGGEGAERPLAGLVAGGAGKAGVREGSPAVRASPVDGGSAPLLSDESKERVPTHLVEMPRSLRGTDVDGGLSVDGDGHFLPDSDAIALFNYFLAASGEEPLARIRERIVDHIHGLLEEPAASQAVELLDTYLEFRDAMRDLAGAGDVPRDIERRWQWIRELRREHFGAATSAALFGQDEEMVRIDLERRRIAVDESLSGEERAAELSALDEELPASVRESRRRARAPTRARAEVARLRAEGASEYEVFEARERYFGRDAAERLSRLDAEQSKWAARLEDYRGKRDALLSEIEDEEPAAQDAALEELRRQHFSELEALRVRSLDKI